MIRNSIFVKITILFIVAIIGLGAISYHFIHAEIDKENKKNQLKYTQFIATINQLVNFGGNISLIEKYLQELELKQITDKKKAMHFEKYLEDNFNDGVMAKIIREEGRMYLLLQTSKYWKLYGDDNSNRFVNYYLLTFIGFFVVVFLFVLVIRSIMPLKVLRSQVRKFSNGNTDISFKLKQNDEIGELADEFDSAVQRINALNQSRHLFLRAIMHELKTPITKGRITAEMVENPTHKQWLCSVFERLNSLINEFAKIEEFSSKNYCLNKQKYELSAILEEVWRMLLLEKEQINELFILPHLDFELWADFDMLTLAIKNLIDNALKYKSGGKVEIAILERDLLIINEGAMLPYSLKEHAKPFFKDVNSNKKGGLGLGIYIVKSTLEYQGLNLSYKHKDGKNIFIIENVIYFKKG